MTRLKNHKKKVALPEKKGRIKHMETTSFANAVWREGKYYVAQSLDVDISSFGKTKLAAIESLKEALESYALAKVMRATESEKNISLKEAKKFLK
jgi:predicted molibdopterin-dependent oxidoreductase YjgC